MALRPSAVRPPTFVKEGDRMEDREKDTLDKIGEPNEVMIFPGIFFEDKLRIVTQRKLEKHFGMPITRIFPGSIIDPDTREELKWNGVDFNYLNNTIPLLTILAQQVDKGVTETDIENALEKTDDENKITDSVQKYMELLSRKAKPKN